MNLNTIPYWLLPNLLLLPAMLWFFLGVGVPWALAVLPRSDWHRPVMVLAVALALGPALVTTGMFVIGTFGTFTVANVLLSSLLIAAIGGVLAMRNRAFAASKNSVNNDNKPSFTTVDFTLIAVVVVALILRFWNTAYWPYTTYDEFWVYGYNAKLFMLRGNIPASVGYYPQLVPLSYTYGQLMWGGINDHAARLVVPMFALGSILMAYLLGARLFNRRVGLLTAAIWALYPQHTAWSQFGDLEVPITFYFTATVVFFISGWREKNRRYLITSGLMMGAALWTKPTAGALIESLLLVMGTTAIYQLYTTEVLFKNRAQSLTMLWRWSKTQAARFPFLALLVAIPMGGMWYIRNILFKHPPLVLPAPYWQVAAQRSGQELGWPLLIGVLVTVLLLLCRVRSRAALGGIALMLLGSLPSAFGYRLPTADEVRQLLIGALPGTIQPSHLNLIEIAIITAGVGLLVWAAWPLVRQLSQPLRETILLLIAFIVPYFVTWFWSYSYHPRLSFAIVPTLIVLVAALLDRLRELTALPIGSVQQRWRAVTLSGVIVALSLLGYVAGATAVGPATTGELPDDHARYAKGNPALMTLVDYLKDRKQPSRFPAAVRHPMRVAIPGEQRLPFFFPNDDIRVEDFPTRLDEIDDANFYVDSSVGQRLYYERGITTTQISASFNRMEIMLRDLHTDDKNFRFDLYVNYSPQRFTPPHSLGIVDYQIGSFAHLVGYDLGRLSVAPGETFLVTLIWKGLGPADRDYSVFIHLWDPRENKLIGQWGGEPMAGAYLVWYGAPGLHPVVPYHTHLWQAGEKIIDEWKVTGPKAPAGLYELRVGLYDSLTGERLPVMQNGVNVGDSIILRRDIEVLR